VPADREEIADDVVHARPVAGPKSRTRVALRLEAGEADPPAFDRVGRRRFRQRKRKPRVAVIGEGDLKTAESNGETAP
jgi:hypothetical protein